MNALVAIRSGFTGWLSPGRAARKAADLLTTSTARANILGRVTKGETMQKIQKAEAAPAEDALGRDTFLRLLVSQIQYQDPLEPVDNTQMVAQLAQFTTLEQMSQLNESFENLSGNIDQLNFISANTLLGREVTAIGADGALVTGTVESVHLEGSVVYLTVNGQTVSMAGVIGISAPAVSDPAKS